MNTAARSLLSSAEILEIDPNTIDVDLTGRLGFYFEDKAEAFGRLLAVDGQRDLVKVSRAAPGSAFAWRLHVGLHRTMGARLAGLPVYAIEVSGSAKELRELEASENLHRRVMAPLERAKFVHAFCEAAQERIAREHGDLSAQQLAVKARWDRVRMQQERAENALTEELEDTSSKIELVYGWQDGAREAFGLSKTAVHYDLTLYRLIIAPFPERAEALSRHPIVGKKAKELRKIADVRDEARRRAVIDLLIADDELGADDARVQAGIPATKSTGNRPDAGAEGQTKFTNGVMSNIERLSPSVLRSLAPTIADKVKPSTLFALRDAFDAKIRALGLTEAPDDDD